VRPDPGLAPGAPLLGFISPSKPNRFPTARAPSPLDRPFLRTTAALSSSGFRLSWVLAPSNATTPGAPSSPHHDLSTAARRVEVARPPPVPSSGFLPLSTVLATHAARTDPCESAVTVAPRRFAALFHAARVPGVALQSFPFPRSRTRSRGPPASLRVRVRPAQRRGTNRGVRGPFPRCADLSPRLARRLAGLEGRDDGSLESLGHCASPVAGLVLQRPRLGSAGLTGYGGRHARFEALLPSRVRSFERLPPWPGDSRTAGALLGFLVHERPASHPAGPTRFRADRTLRVSPQGESPGSPPKPHVHARTL
jgi:hypothetical protein